MAYDPRLSTTAATGDPTEAPGLARRFGEQATDSLGDVPFELRPTPVNLRLLIISAVLLVLMLVAIVWTHNRQQDRIAARFHEQGVQAREAGNTEEAVRHLQRYLSLAPHDIDAVEALAFSIVSSAREDRERYRAVPLFERILRESPGSEAVRRKLVDLYMEIGSLYSAESSRFQDAAEHLDRLLHHDPENAELWALKGECLQQTGALKDARACYEEAIRLAPQNLTYTRRLVSLLKDHLDAEDEALLFLNKLVQQNRQNAEAHLMRSHFHWEHGRTAEARIDGANAYRLAPDDPNVLRFLVTLISEADSAWPAQPVGVSELKTKLTVVADSGEDQSGATDLALVNLMFLEGDLTGAEQRLAALLSEEPDWALAKAMYADALIFVGKSEEAQQIIRELGDFGTEASRLSRHLLAEKALHEKNWQEAEKLYREVYGTFRISPAVKTDVGLRLAECYREMGQPLREQQMYLDILAFNPASAEAVLQLAQTYWRDGDLEAAAKQFQRLPDNPQASAALAQIAIQAQQKRPAAERRWDQVEEVVDRAAQGQPNPVEAAILRTQLLLEKHNYTEAEESVRRALRVHPGESRLWSLALEISVVQQDWEKAHKTLGEAEADMNQSLVARGWRIRLAQLQRDEEALQKLNEVVLADDSEDAVNQFSDLAEAWWSLGRSDLARDWLLRLRAKRPYDLRVLQRMLIVALLEHDDDRAQELVRTMRQLEGDSGTEWRMAEAERLLMLIHLGERERLHDVDQLLEELDNEVADFAALSIRRGDVARLRGDLDAALRHYQTAMNLGTTSQSCAYHAAQILFQRGELDEVSRLIRKLEQSRPDGLTPALAKLGAQASLQQDDMQEALRLATAGANSNADSFQGHIESGLFQFAAEQHEAAEKSFRRAIELAPQEPAGWFALVSFLMARERHEDVAAAVLQAEESVAPELLNFTLAHLSEIQNQPEEASRHYEMVLTHGSGDPRQLEAAIQYFLRTGRQHTVVDVLRSIVADPDAANARTLSVARRYLVMILTDSPHYAERQEALTIIDQSLDESGERTPLPDLILKARLLSASSLRKDHQAAVNLFEQVAANRLLSIADARLLATMYLRLGDREQALETATGIVNRVHRNAEVLDWASRFVLSAGSTAVPVDTVEGWLNTLETLRPNDWQVALLKIRLQLAASRYDEALGAARDLGDSLSAETPAGDRPNQRLEFARACDEIAADLERSGQLARGEDFANLAEGIFRERPTDPRSMSLLARQLLRRWRIDEVLLVCRDLRELASAEDMATIYKVLLQSGQLKSDHLSDLVAWTDAQLAANADTLLLTLLRGHMASTQGDYSLATSCYRRAVELDPQNVEALNELALLLALQQQSLPEAMELIDRAIAESGPRGLLLDTRVTVELAAARPEAAVQSAEAAIQDVPAGVFYFHLAQAQMAIGKPELAKESLRSGFQRGLHSNHVHPLERGALEKLQVDLKL